MDYRLLIYPSLILEIKSIRELNLSTLDRNAEYFESFYESMRDSSVEHFPKMFDGYRSFFILVDEFFHDTQLELKQKTITLGLVDRMNGFGEEAFEQFFNFKENVDKEILNVAPEFKEVLNLWYALIGDNLYSISHLGFISHALNVNFRYIEPIEDVKVEDIAIQLPNGITITKENSIYIDERPVALEGQRRKILLLLIEKYRRYPSSSVSWTTIEEEIRLNTPIERSKVVDRVSDLRTRLAELGFGEDVLEIRNTERGLDSSWRLIKN